MAEPKVVRPFFPKGYVENPTALLSWSQVRERLTQAKNYWLCTVRPDGRLHVIPVWGVWVADRLYYDGSAETRHARNIAQNPHVTVHLESGDRVVIVEGRCRALAKPEPELGAQLAVGYASKYEGYAPAPDAWDDGGLFEVTPQTALAWTSFIDDPTKFVFEEG